MINTCTACGALTVLDEEGKCDECKTVVQNPVTTIDMETFMQVFNENKKELE